MINHDNAVTQLAGAVARIGAHQWPVRLTPTMEVLLAAVAEIAGTEATPDNAEALIEEFGSAARMLGAVIRNTANPTQLGRATRSTSSPPKPRLTSTAASCRATRTSSSTRCARSPATTSSSTSSPTSNRGRPPTTVTSLRR
jgi:hypothetical protein